MQGFRNAEATPEGECRPPKCLVLRVDSKVAELAIQNNWCLSDNLLIDVYLLIAYVCRNAPQLSINNRLPQTVYI